MIDFFLRSRAISLHQHYLPAVAAAPKKSKGRRGTDRQSHPRRQDRPCRDHRRDTTHEDRAALHGNNQFRRQFEVSKPTSKLPVGHYEVSVAGGVMDKDPTEGMEPLIDQKQAAATPLTITVPMRYRDANQSGLGFEIEAGDNDRTIKLKRD